MRFSKICITLVMHVFLVQSSMFMSSVSAEKRTKNELRNLRGVVEPPYLTRNSILTSTTVSNGIYERGVQSNDFSAPDNDNIVDAFNLGLGIEIPNTTYTNVGATTESGEFLDSPCLKNGLAMTHTVWFRFTAPSSGAVSISTDVGDPTPGLLTDTQLVLYSSNLANPTVADLAEIGCDDDSGIFFSTNSYLTKSGLVPGKVYYIQVGGYNGQTGSFGIHVFNLTTPPGGLAPGNDNISSAYRIGVGVATSNTEYTNAGASTESGEPLDGSCLKDGLPTTNTVWYRFIAPSTGAVRISTDIADNGGESMDSQILLYSSSTGNPTVHDLSEIGCDDDSGSASFSSMLRKSGLVPGQMYYVQVGAYNIGTASGGDFGIEIVKEEHNDDFVNAIPLEINTPSFNTQYTNVGSSTEPGERLSGYCFGGGLISQTVWFKFVAPADGKVRINTDIGPNSGNSGLLTDTRLLLYSANGTNPSIGELTLIGCDNNSGNVFELNNIVHQTGLTGGETYYIQVAGEGGAEGTFGITVTSSGDNLEEAIPISVDAPSFNNLYSNTAATTESGEPLTGVCLADQQPTSHTIWFKFTAPSSGAVEISTDIGSSTRSGILTDSQVMLYRSAALVPTMNDLTLLNCDDDSGNTIENNSILIYAGLNLGETYYIQVGGKEDAQGTFGITVKEVSPPPINDNLGNATELIVNNGGDQYTNKDATTELGEQLTGSCLESGQSTDHTVWFKFEAPPIGVVRISTDFPVSGSALNDTEVFLYRRSNSSLPLDVNNLTLISCDDNSVTTTNKAVVVGQNLNAGETYYIQVGGGQGQTGDFEIEVDSVADWNDNFEDALSLTIGDTSQSDDFTNASATVEPDEPDARNTCLYNGLPIQNTVWFKFEAPTSGGIEVNWESDDIADLVQTVLYKRRDLQAAESISNIERIACDNGSVTDKGVRITGLTSGETYYIQAAVVNSSGVTVAGKFGISVHNFTPSVPNDNLENAEAITVGDPPITNTNVGASVQLNEGDGFGSCLSSTMTKTVWFKFEAPESGAVKISTDGSVIDANFLLYSSTSNIPSFTDLTQIGCYEGPGETQISNNGLSMAGLVPEATYFIQLGPKKGEEGQYSLSILNIPDILRPENDNIADAFNLGVGIVYPSIYSNINASLEPSENGNIEGCSSENGTSASNTVWFRFTAPSEPIRIHAIPETSVFAALSIRLYEKEEPTGAAAIDNLNFVPCNLLTTSIYDEVDAYGLVEGKTYYIQVNGETPGVFGIELQRIPANNDIERAIELNVGTTYDQNTFTNENASTENLEPLSHQCLKNGQIDKTVWFKFEAPQSGIIEISTDIGSADAEGALIDSQLVLYTTNGVDPSFEPQNNLQFVGCDDDLGTVIENNSILRKTGLVPGQIYYLQVGGYEGATGFFGLSLKAPPVNDHLKDHFSLTVGQTYEQRSFTNANSSTEASEPLYSSCLRNGQSTDRTVWFSFIAPTSGRVAISTDIGDANAEDVLTDSQLFLYYSEAGNPSFSDLIFLICDDDSGSNIENNSVVHYEGLIPERIYYIQVGGYGGATGDFGIVVKETPINDHFAGRIALDLGTDYVQGSFTNVDATTELNESLTSECLRDELPTSNTVWFSFVAPESKGVSINTTKGDRLATGVLTDSQLLLYKRTDTTQVESLSNLTLIGCNDDAGNGHSIPFNGLLNQGDLNPGETYYLQVGGYGNQTGAFGIQIKELPINDNISEAITLTMGTISGQRTYTNRDATLELNEPVSADCLRDEQPTSHTVWFKFIAPASRSVEITTDIGDRWAAGVLTDSQLLLYKKIEANDTLSFDNLQLVACKDDGGTTIPFNGVLVTSDLTPGETYYLQVGGYDNQNGDFGIGIEAIAVNDNLADATPLILGASATQDSFNNFYTSRETNEPVGDCHHATTQNTVWFSFLAPSSGRVYITTDIGVATNPNAVLDTRMMLFRKTDVNAAAEFGNLTAIACDEDGGFTIDGTNRLWVSGLTHDERYYIQIGADTQGTFGITVEEFIPSVVVENDNFSNATALDLGVTSTQDAFTNVDATIEVDEPIYAQDCIASTRVHTVWFSFVAPNSGKVEISTDIGNNNTSGALTNTELVVFERMDANSPANFSNLREIGCDDNSGSTIIFNNVLRQKDLTAGETYYVQVAGFGGHEGTFGIEVKEIPVNDDLADAMLLAIDDTSNSTEYTNVGASIEANESTNNSNCLNNDMTHSTWFRFVAPESGSVTVDLTTGSLTNPKMMVYHLSGSEVNFSNLGTPVNGGCIEDTIGTISNLIANNMYYIQVDGSNTGTFGISLIDNYYIALSPKVFLYGAYNTSTNLMNDDLRSSGVIPASTPYTDGVTINTSVFDVTGNDAIVDWVYVELRDKDDITSVIAGASAFVQRDGDVVGADGVSPIRIAANVDEYYIAISHRNHISIATNTTYGLSETVTAIDLTVSTNVIGGVEFMQDLGGGKHATFGGDLNGDGQINTTDLILGFASIGFPGYLIRDLDLNGQTQTSDMVNVLAKALGKGKQF